MPISYQVLEDLIFKSYDRTVVRFLQNSPIYPGVWLGYAKPGKKMANTRIDLILTPHNKSSAAELFKVLYDVALKEKKEKVWELATNGETVAVKFTFTELVCYALPLTFWWKNIWGIGTNALPKEQDWLKLVIGAILTAQSASEVNKLTNSSKNKMRKLGSEFITGNELNTSEKFESVLWSVNKNRKAFISMKYSVPCTKADAARRLFDIDGTDLTWAVVDSGIDATHDAFRKIDPENKKMFDPAMSSINDGTCNKTRIIATYDFTKFRRLVSGMLKKNKRETLLEGLPTSDKVNRPLDNTHQDLYIRDIEKALEDGRMLDWTVLGPLLRIPHFENSYIPPEHPHGTHVAGIIGAGRTADLAHNPLVGMCPRINIYDFRVLDENGEGDEFNIIAALQFIRWINQHEGLNIHGVNMSMSLLHDVETYACGQTPVCVSVNRLVEEGVVVVCAAGNQGQSMYQTDSGESIMGFRTVNITDPGNAEDVITVGATHRNEPHKYGVSYFSSKGPTGDGRLKPDLVAPGEKIYSSVLDSGEGVMDGTSMAAPHVSGAAALLMAKHRELIGRPRKIKEILCKSATNLGREPYFQGSGMVDVLRAIQSV